MLVTMHKAEKYAVDMRSLDDETRSFLMKNFGCARKVYNLYVELLYDELEKRRYIGDEPLPDISLPEVTVFKKDYPYLKDADSLALANAKMAFRQAVARYNEKSDYMTYTKRAVRRDKSGTEPLSFRGLKGMPRFNAKAHGDFSFTTNCQYPSEGNNLKRPTVRLEKNILYLPKLKNGLKVVLHRPLPSDACIGHATISMDTDGRIYASIEYSYLYDMNMTLREAVLSGKTPEHLDVLGLDYSQKFFYVDSRGRIPNCPHAYTENEERLGELQRQLSRMQKDSNNYKKKLSQIQKLSIRIRNQRLDFIRKEASYLAGRYDVIGVEDIDMRAMGEGLSLGKNLHDMGFGKFRELLARKLWEKGSALIRIDRSFPSTKRCSACGKKNPAVVLGISEWICPECGTHHDRDINAAVNIEKETRRVFSESFAEMLEEDAKARERAEEISSRRKRKRKP